VSDFVFVNLAGGELGRAMRDGRAREVVGALGRRAGIERVVTPHQFRHGLRTELVESGRSLDEVQMILGHAQVETTRRYTHTSRARDCVTRSTSVGEAIHVGGQRQSVEIAVLAAHNDLAGTPVDVIQQQRGDLANAQTQPS
jgi:Phage integrase family